MKRILLAFGVAFVAYTVIVAPSTAASATKDAVGNLSTAGQAVGHFFDALIS